jgi:hypothetical protein
MRHLSCGLLVLLLAACGGGPNEQQKEEAVQASARVAERNLVKIRDAVLEYHRKNGTAPERMDDLAAFGVSAENLEPSENYADLGYMLYKIAFNKDGTMTSGWFQATPMEGRNALRVRLNGVTGKFDYAKSDEPYAEAPADNGG